MENEQDQGINTGSGADSERLPELLALALDVVPDAAVVVDECGRIVGTNGALVRLFGHPPEALIGKPIELLIPERYRHAHRHHRGAFFVAPRQRAMGGAGLQLAGRRRDATEFPVDISLAPIEVEGRGLVVAAVRDATERGAVTAAVGQLAAIVSSSRDGILTVTTAGVVTTWNPGAEQLLGTPTEEAIGSHIGRWIPEEASEVVEELMGTIVTGGSPSSRDTVWLTADGKRLDVAISMSPMSNEHRELAGFSILVRDVSERKAAEAIRDRQRRQQEATAEIRLASLSEHPIGDILELICMKTLELSGGEGVAIVRERHGDPAVVAGCGAQQEAAVMELASAALASCDPAASRLGLSVTESGEPREVVGALVPAGKGGRGALVVTLPTGREAGGEMRRLIEGFAGQAALAIELSAARAARERLLLAEDRERIARDLHDLVIQRLFATGMTLQTLQQFTGDEVLAGRLQRATDELDATIREIRTTIFALEEAPESAEGVRGELLRMVSAATKNLGFHPSLQFDGPVDLVDDEVRHHVLAVTREALSNVARHARASSVSVLVVARDGLTITVEDDGVGLPERRDESGLANIRSRADDLGGELLLENRAEGGARMVWRVPAR